MNEEERNEEVVPEVEAAWCRLMVGYLNFRGPIESRSISGIKGGLEYFKRWLGILEAEDVPAAFRKQVLEDLAFWGKYAGAAAEVEPVEEALGGTPLVELGLSTRVYNALCKGFKTMMRDFIILPCVEDILRILEEKGEGFLLQGHPFKGFGPRALAELKGRLVEKGFLPVEEE